PPQMAYVLDHCYNEPELFRRELLMDAIAVEALAEALEVNPVFHNTSNNSQRPVIEQLAVVLYRFGHYGNAAGLHKVAQWAGCAKGTVHLYTQRVMKAILSPSFLNSAVRLPTEEEKEKAKSWVEKTSGVPSWRDGWCFVDGTLIPLYVRPHWYGPSYFDRKCNYSLNIQ
ncbi:hypothetical protein DFP72DRAFT_749589, partial [Ephemerocybe angulata]